MSTIYRQCSESLVWTIHMGKTHLKHKHTCITHVVFAFRNVNWHTETVTKWTRFSQSFSWMTNVWVSIKFSPKFVPINNITALVQIMALRRSGDKPLSEQMMVILRTHIWVNRPLYVKCDVWYHSIHMTYQVLANTCNTQYRSNAITYRTFGEVCIIITTGEHMTGYLKTKCMSSNNVFVHWQRIVNLNELYPTYW